MFKITMLEANIKKNVLFVDISCKHTCKETKIWKTAKASDVYLHFLPLNNLIETCIEDGACNTTAVAHSEYDCNVQTVIYHSSMSTAKSKILKLKPEKTKR